MKIDGVARRTIELCEDGWRVRVIDQRALPFALQWLELATLDDAARAISTMAVRGAPLIGAAAAYGVALAMRASRDDAALERACATLAATRPTAVNLAWALAKARDVLAPLSAGERADAAYAFAAELCEADVRTNRAIAEHGRAVLARHTHAGRPLEILTHCNAGWLATVDWGTALAPIYLAHDEGVPLHVWVEETRPRNQGAALTAWELGVHGVPHTIIADNAGGHLMQRGRVDLVLVGTDRTTALGDVCNKIGTYLKALAAHDCGVPFYVAAPSSSLDFRARDGLRDIPIEERAATEVTHLTGRAPAGDIVTVQLTPPRSAAANPAFDVTPARLVTGLITERGVVAATERALAERFADLAEAAARSP